jgi:hypothetical protein
MRLVAASTAGVVLVLGGMAGPAQADAPVDPVEHYSGSFANDSTECGLDLHFEVTFGGRYSAQPAPGSDEAFLAHDRYSFSETITLAGVEDSPYVTTQVSGNFRETQATLLDADEPTIYQFTGQDAGTFRLYDSEGTLLVSSSGVFKFVNVQDTLGDKAPGSDFIEDVATAFHGNEAGDFCDALEAELTL